MLFWLFLCVVLFDLLVTLLTGRVLIARAFTRVYFANRRDTPAGYWLFVLVEFGFAAVIAWWAAQATGLHSLLPAGVPLLVEKGAPYAAILALAIFAVCAYAAERRRRARMRAQHPSAVERASGGV